jgi:hypothetical protein
MMSLEIVTNWFIRNYWNPECLLVGQYNGMGYGNSSWITGKCNSNMWVKYVSTCQTLCIQLETWSWKRFLLFLAPLRARRELVWSCRDSFHSGHVCAGRTTWSLNYHWHVSFKTWFELWTPHVRVHEQEWAQIRPRQVPMAPAAPAASNGPSGGRGGEASGSDGTKQRLGEKGGGLGVRNYLGAVFMAFFCLIISLGIVKNYKPTWFTGDYCDYPCYQP